MHDPDKSVTMKLIPFLFAFFLSTIAFSQNLVLTNGQKHKTFKTVSFVKILVPSRSVEPCEACEGDFVAGRIVSYREGILTLEVIRTGEVKMENGKQIGFIDTRYSGKPGENVKEFAKQDILSITQQGKKEYKRTTTVQAIGYTAIILSLGQLASIPFADENRDMLAVVGLTELGLGIIMASTFDAKRYVTNINCPSAPRIPDQIWKLK